MKSLFYERVRICFFGCFFLFAFIGSAFAGNSYRPSNAYGDKTMVVFGGWDVYSGNREVIDIVQDKGKRDERELVLSDFETYMKTAGSPERKGEQAKRFLAVVKNYIKPAPDGFTEEIKWVRPLLDEPWDYHDDEHWLVDLARNMGISLVADYSTPMGFISTLGQRKKLMGLDEEVNMAEDSLFFPSLTSQVFEATHSNIKNVGAILLSAGLEDILNWLANQRGNVREWEYVGYAEGVAKKLVSSIGDFLKEKCSSGPVVLVFVKQEVKRFESMWTDFSESNDLGKKLEIFNGEVFKGLEKMLGDDFKEVSLLQISPDDISRELLNDGGYSDVGELDSYQVEIEDRIKSDQASGWDKKVDGLGYAMEKYFNFLAIAEGDSIRGLIRDRLKGAYCRHEISSESLRDEFGSRPFYSSFTDSIDFGDKMLDELCSRLKGNGGRTQCIAEERAGKIKVSRIRPEYKTQQGLAESVLLPWINGYVDKAGNVIGNAVETAFARLLDQHLGLKGR